MRFTQPFTKGNFKRKTRPQDEINAIYNLFSKEELNYVNNIYSEYLKRFQSGYWGSHTYTY